VQNHAYPIEKYSHEEGDLYSLKRMVRYFVKPWTVNFLSLDKVIKMGKRASLLYPRRGPNPVQIDNKSLEGFIDRFRAVSCQPLDCDECRYCHEWADRVVRIDPEFERDMKLIYAELLDDLHSGSFWDSYVQTISRTALGRLRDRPS
jgi:hypothetical protein